MLMKQPAFAIHQAVTLVDADELTSEPVEIIERHYVSRQQKWGYYVRFLALAHSSTWMWEYQLSAEEGKASA